MRIPDVWCGIYTCPDKESLVGFVKVSVGVSEKAGWEVLSVYVSTEKVWIVMLKIQGVLWNFPTERFCINESYDDPTWHLA